MKRVWLIACGVLISVMLFVSQNVAQTDDKKEPEKCPEPIYKPGEVTRKARITHVDDPEYTKEAWQHGIKGRVLLRAVLCADGHVTNVEVLKGLPYGLTENALATMPKMKFKPAQKDGHPVSVIILREFYFSGDW